MRPMVYLVAALSAGIAAAGWLRPHPVLALGALLLCGVLAAFTERRTAIVLLLAVVAAFGAFRYAYVQTAGRGNVTAWLGDKVTVTGTVTTEPELRKPQGVGYVVRVEQVDKSSATGLLYVSQRGSQAPRFGERVEFQGALKPPLGPRTPGGFDQAAFLARQGVYTVVDIGSPKRLGPGDVNFLRRLAVGARIRLESVLKATLPQREAALMAGLLFGSRSDLPDDINQAFKMSGVFHLLSVSGGNLAMVVMPLLVLLRRTGLSKQWASAAALPVVIFFVFLTGAGPSVLRAGLMAVLVLVGDMLRRERDAVNTLGAAGFILLLVDPRLLFDIGFQLSAGATLGILLFARRIETWLAPRFQWVFGERAGAWLAAGLSVTLAAQVMVEPVSLYNFGTFSAIAPVANLIVLAFLEPVVQIGAVAVLVGLVLVPLAWALNWIVRVGLWLLVFLVKATAAVPGAYLEVGRLPFPALVLWYVALAFLTVPALRTRLLEHASRSRRWWSHHSRRAAWAAGFCTLLLLPPALTWRLALAGPPDQLQVSFIDVGQGDAILIQAPTGETMLVDAGPYLPGDPKTGRRGYDSGTEVVLPSLADLGVKRLDYLVLTHPDLDHAGAGPSILRGIPVGTVLKSDQNPTEKRYLEALQVAAEKGVPIRNPVAGETLQLGRDVVLEVLTPPAVRYEGTRSDDNSNCIALRLTYRQVAMIFACDLEGEIEEKLVAQGANLRADLLKAAHHGSGYSTTAAFLQAVHPTYAVLSVGNGNKYGHPAQQTLKRLEAQKVQVYRTDRHGTVVARTDGVTFTVRGERGRPVDDQYRPLGLLGRRWLFAW
ncbi:MAG TPA: DNA internalization-related competence protein ComEC/Rec2 [Symbiobacteriaceae bacterium]|nr:DNA internalization-related competence protein ComEC/Rec2 [Symbiobacteriaceae bacterium]